MPQAWATGLARPGGNRKRGPTCVRRLAGGVDDARLAILVDGLGVGGHVGALHHVPAGGGYCRVYTNQSLPWLVSAWPRGHTLAVAPQGHDGMAPTPRCNAAHCGIPAGPGSKSAMLHCRSGSQATPRTCSRAQSASWHRPCRSRSAPGQRSTAQPVTHVHVRSCRMLAVGARGAA